MFKTKALLLAAVLAVPAQAETVSVTCASNAPGPWPGSMFCSDAKLLSFTPPSPGSTMMMKITAPAAHCSEITYLVHRFGSSEPIAVIERLKPGNRKRVSLGADWAEGQNSVTLTAVGHVGGCNTGTLLSWGAEVQIAPR